MARVRIVECQTLVSGFRSLGCYRNLSYKYYAILYKLKNKNFYSQHYLNGHYVSTSCLRTNIFNTKNTLNFILWVYSGDYSDRKRFRNVLNGWWIRKKYVVVPNIYKMYFIILIYIENILTRYGWHEWLKQLLVTSCVLLEHRNSRLIAGGAFVLHHSRKSLEIVYNDIILLRVENKYIFTSPGYSDRIIKSVRFHRGAQ